MNAVRTGLMFVAVSAAASAVSTVGCLPRSHPTNYANTVINNLCHVSFDCCTPAERSGFLFAAGRDKNSCVEEFNDLFGGLMQDAQGALDTGTGEYDAEAAERCTGELQPLVDACDMQGIADATGELSQNTLIFGVDARDAECVALAQRAFVRGNVGEGGACRVSVDCADFGICVFGDEDGGLAFGECELPHVEGEACDDGRGCTPGLVCQSDGDGFTCAEPELLANGDACKLDDECTSRSCSAGDGACEGSGDFCGEDFDCSGSCVENVCAGDGAACDFDFDCPGLCVIEPGVCEEVSLTVEICDGQ